MSKHEIGFDPDTGAYYGSHRSYAMGFVLSVVLTLLAFYVVSATTLPTETMYLMVGGLAVLQFFVQAVFFLHLNTHSRSMWNLLSFLFTFVVVAVLIVGTMWIMYNLYEKMGMNAMNM